VFRVTLYFRTESQVDGEWTAFVHLLKPDGSLLAGMDQQPMGGLSPTTSWSPSQIVAYTVALPIPATAEAGEYRVGLGWYQWPALERLVAQSDALPVSDQLVNLGALFVQQISGEPGES
jgi:hypothetical protein